MRESIVHSNTDSAGQYEVEIFDSPNPRRVVVCVHGNGVRRWDGEEFYYKVAEHYADSTVMLVDLNQQEGEGVKINPLPILSSRVQGLIDQAKKMHPGTTIVIIGHSMGCGVITQLDLADVSAVFFVAAAVGSPQPELIKRFGPDIAQGKTTTSSDGLKKIITAEYFDSIKDINWEDEYNKLVQRYSPVYAYEAAEDEILDDRRFAHRNIPFTSYNIISAAKHNLTGQPLADLFNKLDQKLKIL
jgi:hypothetical protein